MKSKNVIEINGKLYDARTGTLLSAPKKKTPAVVAKKAGPAPTTAKKVMRPKSIDGFTRRTGGSIKLHPTKKTRTEAPVVTAPKSAKNRETAAPIKLKAKRSTTLSRNFVSAPQISITKPAEATSSSAGTVSSTALKQADAQRLERAQQVSKSTIISRFNHGQATENTKTIAPAARQKLSTATGSNRAQAQPTKTTESAKHTSTKERLIKTALENAVAQHAPDTPHATKRKKSKHHVTRYATTALAVLLLAAYVAYLNVPSISMKVAAHRAGFAANLPTYKPAGYSLRGPIAYSPGQVTLSFASNTDQRKFTLKQQPTVWDSTALLENYVTKKSSNYLTYQDSGLTIYILDNGDAAWVNGGKFYQVEASKASLDTNQLLKLATGA
jgi:hypothetical protein